MTNYEKILEYLQDNPKATNPEIAEATGVNSISTCILRLKNKGFLEVEKDGESRIITVVKDLPVSKNEYKKDILRELLEIYLEEMREAISLQEKIELGKLILKITERL